MSLFSFVVISLIVFFVCVQQAKLRCFGTNSNCEPGFFAHHQCPTSVTSFKVVQHVPSASLPTCKNFCPSLLSLSAVLHRRETSLISAYISKTITLSSPQLTSVTHWRRWRVCTSRIHRWETPPVWSLRSQKLPRTWAAWGGSWPNMRLYTH